MNAWVVLKEFYISIFKGYMECDQHHITAATFLVGGYVIRLDIYKKTTTNLTKK